LGKFNMFIDTTVPECAHCQTSHMIDNGYDLTAEICPISDLMHCAGDAAQ